MRNLILLALMTASLAKSASPGIYITVTGANVRRAKLALVKLAVLPGGTADLNLAKEIEAQTKFDLEFANLFEFIPPEIVLETDKAKDLYQVKYEDWSAKGVSFVLKMGYRVEAGKLVMEALLFDIPGQKKLFGNRYQFPSNQSYRVVHAMAEDVLKELSGEKGLFSTRVAMVCRNGKGNKEIYVADMDGRNFTGVTSDNTLSLSPAWAPDGKTLLYTQFASLGRGKRGTVLRVHNLTTGDRKVLSSREGMNSGASWSPTNSKIALTLSFNGRPEIYLVNPGGAGEPEPFSRQVKIKRVGDDGFLPNWESLLFDVEPSWSPDGTKIVFSSARTKHPMIYTADVNTKIGNQLTFAGTYNATPDWSPKGDKILFAAQRLAEGNFDLYVIDPDGNNLNRITVGDRAGRRRVNSENPSWAPTGRHFVFSNNEGGAYAVYIMTLDGNVKKKISPDKKDCSEPSWGPVS